MNWTVNSISFDITPIWFSKHSHYPWFDTPDDHHPDSTHPQPTPYPDNTHTRISRWSDTPAKNNWSAETFFDRQLSGQYIKKSSMSDSASDIMEIEDGFMLTSTNDPCRKMINSVRQNNLNAHFNANFNANFKPATNPVSIETDVWLLCKIFVYYFYVLCTSRGVWLVRWESGNCRWV